MLARVRSLLSPGTGPPFREIVRAPGWYPLTSITALNLVDELERAVLAVFAPEIRRYFDINNTQLGGIIAAQVVLYVLAGVPLGYLGTRINRASILRWSAAAWAAITFITAFAVTFPFFVITRLLTGIGRSSMEPVGRSLLTDYYPPMGWNRILALNYAANPAGQLIGPLIAGLVGVLVAGDGVWRWAYPVLAVPTIAALLYARRLDEPENQMVRGLAAHALTITSAPSDLPFIAACRRLISIPTFKRQLVGVGVLGFGLVALLAFGSVLLEEEFDVSEGGRGVVLGILATAALIGTLIGGNVGERIFEASPSRATYFVGGSIAAFSVILGVAVLLPWLWALVAILWFAILALSIAASPLGVILAAISPPRLRPLIFSLLGFFIAVFGGFFGAVVVGAIADATNMRIGLASVCPFGVVGGLLMTRGAATIDADIAKVQEEVGALPF